MAGTGGALATPFDFGEIGPTASAPVHGARLRSPVGELRLAARRGLLRGPGKYKVLEHRRRQAQIAARHVLDLFDEIDSGRGREEAQ